MNKSTPLNQLPNNPMLQNSFVNEPQRQIVTNAQQAVGNMNMPQNTQMLPDGGDDDAEIQEALNDVNAQLMQQQQPQRPPQMMGAATHVQESEYMAQQPPQYMPMPNIPIENQAEMMFMQGAGPSRYIHAPSPVAPAPSFTISDIMTRFADDVKLAVTIATVVAAVHFIPFDSIIGKYFAIENIPYHDIILRAVFAAIIVIVVKNLVLTRF